MKPGAANGAASPSNSSPELMELLSVADALLGSPAADGYSADQKQAIVAFSMRLHDPRLGEVLGRLHQLAILAWGSGCKSVEPALHKTLAVLLDVRIGAADSLGGAVLWRLARERVWRRESRLRALALFLKCAVSAEEELLKAALKAAPATAVSALCLLCDVDAGASLVEARQAIVCKLARSKLPAPIEASLMAILGLLLECDASAQKVLAQLPASGWGTDAVDAAKQLLAKTQAEAAPGKLEASTLRSILRDASREKQLARLAAVLQVPKEDKAQDVAVLKALADCAEKLPAAIARVALGIAVGCPVVLPPDDRDDDLAAAKISAEALMRHIADRGAKQMQTADARLRACACLLQAPPKLDAVLRRLARATGAGALAPAACKELVECLFAADAAKDAKRAPLSRAALLAALEKVRDLPQDAQKAIAEAINAAPSAPPSKAAPGGKAAAKAKAAGRAVLRPAAASAPKAEEQEAGWSALKALVEADSDEEGEAEGWDALKALVEDEDDEEDGGQEAKQAGAGKTGKGTGDANSVRRQDTASSGLREESAEDDEEDDAAEEDEDDDEAGAVSESEAESYGGSELDPLDFRGGSDAPSDEEGDGEDDGDTSNFDLGSGLLLTSMFGGGSLHSEDRVKRRGQESRPTKIRVVFPSLIWRGKDVLVVNKPADWICSASDVDKKKGRKLDPNEKCGAKNFWTLEDLLQYKFADREKKYIHWWIQLMHDLDHKAYPNLFDEDQNYGLCHRLDRETSGTVLVGLTQLARQQMRECFHRHYVRKLYVCLAHGKVEPREQTVDRNIEAMGQKARLDPNGKRARTHVKVLGYFTKANKSGGTETYSLCTCEIAEGRMHQIRLHMSAGLGAAIVSEFYYQKPRQMVEDRRWCQRVFLHSYAVGFPDVSGDQRRVGNDDLGEEKCGLVEEAKRDSEQEWHCCICPLTKELRNALQEITPVDDAADGYMRTIMECGLLDPKHESVHVMGTESRKTEIDDQFFPWSSQVNPIDAGDLNKPRDGPKGKGGGKFKGRGKGGGGGGDGDGDNSTLKAKAKPRRRPGLLPGRCGSISPRGRGYSDGPGGKRLRMTSRAGRDRRFGPGRSRSGSASALGPPSLRGPGRRGRSNSRGRGFRGRPLGGLPSPRGRSPLSLGPRRKRRRGQSASLSPPNGGGGRAPPLRGRALRAGSAESLGDGKGRKGRGRDRGD